MKIFQSLWECLNNSEFDKIPISTLDSLIESEILVASNSNELDAIMLESQVSSSSIPFDSKFEGIDFCKLGDELVMSINQNTLVKLIAQKELKKIIEKHKVDRLFLNISQLQILEKISLENRLKINVFLDCRKSNSEAIIDMLDGLINSFTYTNATLVFYLDTSINDIDSIVSLINRQERWRIVWDNISDEKVIQNDYFESFMLPINSTGSYWKIDDSIDSQNCIDGFIFKKNVKRVLFDSTIKKKLSQKEIHCSECKFLPICGGHEMKLTENDDFCPSFVKFFDTSILTLFR